MTEPTPPPLDYGNHPPLAWIGKNRKKLIALAILLAIVGPLAWYREPLWDLGEWHYWMRQAAAHRMPEGLAVVTSSPSEIAKYSNHPDYVVQAVRGGNTDQLVYSPRALRELVRLDPRFAVFANGPTSYLGILHRPDGQPRLVAVLAPTLIVSSANFRGYVASGGPVHVVVAAIPAAFDTIPPAVPPAVPVFINGLNRPASVTTRVLNDLAIGNLAQPSQIFPARIDPDDPSHLVISTLTERGSLHLFLQNDDTIRQEADMVQTPHQIIRQGNSSPVQ